MKTKLLTLIALLGLTANWAYAADNLVITTPGTNTATTGGTFSPTANFTFSMQLHYPATPPANVASNSLWWEVPNAIAAFITITSQTFGAENSDPGNPSQIDAVRATQTTDYPMSFNVAATDIANYQRDAGASANGDLGGGTTTGNGVAASATNYYLSSLSFHLANAPVGTYTMFTRNLTSTSDDSGTATFLPQASFVITIVPEPATLSLLGLGTLGAFGLNLLRARRRS